MRAIQILQAGGPDVLQLIDVDDPSPGPDQVRVRVAAAGVNFIDTYQRSGVYPLQLPSGLGLEGAGTVEAVGAGVQDLRSGDRVGWVAGLGSYAQRVVVAAEAAVPVPGDIDDRVAAAVLLQGMTAHYLATGTYQLGASSTALVYAAAGGVGHLLTQIAAAKGARVIATASSAEKEDLARQAGAHEVVRYRDTDIAAEVRGLTAGRGVDVVYDSVGKDTFAASLDCLRPRGVMVLYGQSSGPVPPLDPQTLNAKGGLFLTRPSLAQYTATRDELLHRAGELFDWIRAGSLQVRIDRTWPLDDAAEAHRYLEAGRTRGKLLLLPD